MAKLKAKMKAKSLKKINDKIDVQNFFIAGAKEDLRQFRIELREEKKAA